MKDIDAQFLCKDCSGFNLCQYYDRRKEDSYICKYFHLTETCEMTNGDVMKVLFPNCSIVESNRWIGMDINGSLAVFTRELWNAKYKRGEE